MNAVISEGGAESGRDRRRYARASLRLRGRYLLEDGSEHSCECLDISVGGLRLKAAKAGPWGSKVIAYIDGLGRVEGYLVRRAPGWFAIEVHVSERKESRLAERIQTLLESVGGPPIDRRQSGRFHQSRDAVMLVSADGTIHEAQLADVSAEGAAVLTEGPFAIGDRLGIGERTAIVMRVFPGGVALAFEREPKLPRRRASTAQPAEG